MKALADTHAANLTAFCGVSYGALEWAVLLPILLEVATALLSQGCGKKATVQEIAARAADRHDIAARAFLRTVVSQSAQEFPERFRSPFAQGQIREALTEYLRGMEPEEREALFAQPVDWAQSW